MVDNTKTRRLEHAFALENISSTEVSVDEVESSCGCVVANDHPTVIAPKSRAVFRVSVELAGPPRAFRKFVTVHLATLPRSKVVLAINGEVEASPAFYSTPATVDFGALAAGESRTRTVKVARYDGSPVKFVRGVVRSDAVSLQKATTGDEADSFVELTLSLDASRLRTGNFATSLIVQTSNATHTQFELPVQARISGAPDRLVRSIFVRSLREGEFQDKPLTVDGASASVETVSYEGKALISIELLAPDREDSAAPRQVRVSRGDEAICAAKPKVVAGHVLVTLAGQTAPVRVPLFVQLTN